MEKFVGCSSHVTVGALKTFPKLKASFQSSYEFENLNCPACLLTGRLFFISHIPQNQNTDQELFLLDHGA